MKTPSPAVSVIIPTYNRAWIVKEAIDSVFAQTYRDFELIVVDDGSTDDTCSVLNAFGSKISVIRQGNQGVSAARNAGIKASNGRYIAFLDSDDCWLAEKLSVQVAFFNDRPDAMICQTEETWIRNGLRVNPKNRHKKPSGPIFIPSLALCLVSPSAVMMPKTLFKTVGMFDETLPACEDYDLWLRVSCRFPVDLIDVPLILKRGGHADQLSKIAGLDKYRIQSLLKVIAQCPLSPDQHEAAVDMLRQKCTIYAGGCRKRGRYDEAAYYENLANSRGSFTSA